MAAEGCGLPLAAQASPRNLKRPRRLRRRVKRATHRLRRRAPEQLVLVDLVVDAVKVRASNDLAGVQERDALALCAVTTTLARQNGLFRGIAEGDDDPHRLNPPARGTQKRSDLAFALEERADDRRPFFV